jgi:hypothetical protein
MCGLERVGYLNTEIQQRRKLQRAVVREIRRQSLTFNKLHDDEIDAIDFFDRVNGDDVWMIQN